MTNLIDYKNKKKAKLIYKDLNEISVILNNYIKELEKYKYYSPVQHIIQTTYDNKHLVTLFIERYKKTLDEGKNNE